jgi:uncharacterized protein YqjF (DUF2071 family)
MVWRMPDLDRLAPSRRPERAPSGDQRWQELFFLHWTFDPSEVAPLVPAGMSLDLWEGRAYVGLVPFRMRKVRPSWLPRLAAMDFLETNVRTYVVVNGEPGVLFFSLEASSWLAVQAARRGWGLPYYHARMGYAREGDRIRYASARRGDPRATLRFDGEIGEALGPSEPGSLEFFLLERYLLFTEWRGTIYRGQVHHVPYPARRARVHAVESGLLEAAGLPARREPPALAHYSGGVDIAAFGPDALAPPRRGSGLVRRP